MPTHEWAERVIPMIAERDQGVAMTTVSLITTMAQDNLELFAPCYQQAVDRLDKIVFDAETSPNYVYYKVPNPWLQIKLLRLLQYYPPPGELKSLTSLTPDNPEVIEMVNGVVQAIIDMSQETPRVSGHWYQADVENVQHNNAQNSVLFEAINLAIHLDPESKVVSNASVLLGRFILARETNVRYLGLDAMAHLAACSTSLEPVKRHQDTIILSLKDRDISVRRRGLDLLYSMCDTTNSKVIVGELLRYLQIADYNLREEMVLKIAILTERFATEVNLFSRLAADRSMNGTLTPSSSSFPRLVTMLAPKSGTVSSSLSPTTRTYRPTHRLQCINISKPSNATRTWSRLEATSWESLVTLLPTRRAAALLSSSTPCTPR